MKKTHKKSVFNSIAAKELRLILPVFLAVDGLIILSSVILSFMNGVFLWKMLTGAAIGTAVSVMNFLLIGNTAEQTLNLKNTKRATVYANASYGLRYIGMFIILGASLYFEIAEFVSLVAPLFCPKIYYFIEYIFKRKGEDI